MSEHNGRGGSGLVFLYGMLVLVGVLLTIVGAREYRNSGEAVVLAMGMLGVVIPLATFPIASALFQSLGASSASGSTSMIDMLRSINERLLISDTAKRIAFREKDRSALRDAIRQDMSKTDFDAALVLVDQMAKVYGYREEAESYRQQILAAREADQKRKIAAERANLDRLIVGHQWAEAVREAAKIQRLFPEAEETRGLVKLVRDAREGHKHELERRFLEAEAREDFELAMDLLKELDLYLTEAEAEPFREHARRVIARKRDNYRVQFELAVKDEDFQVALRVGEQIVRDFPNTKMADEVRSLIPMLKERAAGQRAAAEQVVRMQNAT